MEIKDLFVKLKDSQKAREEVSKTDEAMLEKFLQLMSLVFQFEHGGLSAEAERELLDAKGFMEKTEAKLKRQDQVKELAYIYDATIPVGELNKKIIDSTHPERQDTGAYIVHLPTNYGDIITRMIEKRRKTEAAKPPKVLTKEELIDSGLFSYCSGGALIAAAAKTAELSVGAFKAELKKLSKDTEKLKTFFGPYRWRNLAEAKGILEPTNNRQKMIEDIGNQRMEGLSVCALAKKFKVPLGVVTSILGHFRGLGYNWLYSRYFSQYGEEWEGKAQIAFNHRLYMVGVKSEFMTDGRSEKEFEKQQTDFRFKDGFILA